MKSFTSPTRKILKTWLSLFALLITLSVSGMPISSSDTNSTASFITVWQTDYYGISNNSQIRIPAYGQYDYTWEEVDDPSNTGSGSGTNYTTITFPHPGIYRVEITPAGDNPFHRFAFESSTFAYINDCDKLIEIEQWGEMSWSSFKMAFRECSNLVITATDTPDLSLVTDMSYAFESTNLITIPYLNEWDVSNVIAIKGLFKYVTNFNQDIGNWDVSNVKYMSGLFFAVPGFNQDISNWDVSNAIDLENMFAYATNFNQDIGNWDVSKVKNMKGMFVGATSFNQNIGNWDVSNVINMNDMFANAANFNQDISNWDVSNVKYMSELFYQASSFNQDLGNWNLASLLPQPFWLQFNENELSGENSSSFEKTSFNTPNLVNTVNEMPDFSSVANKNHVLESTTIPNMHNWDMNKMMARDNSFYSTSGSNPDLGNWLTIPHVNYCSISFDYSGMSCENWSATLQGWADNPDTPYSLYVRAEEMKYSPNVQSAVNYLFGNRFWMIFGMSQGTCSLLPPVFDCPELEANIGDDCYDNDEPGVVTEDCNCYVEPSYDCPGLEANIGDDCWEDDEQGQINQDCECHIESTGDTGPGGTSVAGDGDATLTIEPNPSTGDFFLRFNHSEPSVAQLEIFDLNGRYVATVFNGDIKPNQEYLSHFDGTYLPNGVYISRLTTHSQTIIQKFVIAR